MGLDEMLMLVSKTESLMDTPGPAIPGLGLPGLNGFTREGLPQEGSAEFVPGASWLAQAIRNAISTTNNARIVLPLSGPLRPTAD